MTPWLETFVADAHARLLALPETHEARQYLRSRGVLDEWLALYRLGWIEAPSIAACTPECWEWLRLYGWDKIVFPLTDPFGAVTGLQIRSPREKGYRDFVVTPKELCPPCFGLHVGLPAAFASKRLVIVEGVFDYFAVRRYATDSVAILTSAASLALKRLFARYLSGLVCLLDMDAPGRRGSYRLAGLPIPPQYLRPQDRTTRPAPLPAYQVWMPVYSEHDPSDLLAAGKVDELERLCRLGGLYA